MARHHKTIRVVVMILVGIVAALVTGFLGRWEYAPSVGWVFAALTYSIWVWIVAAPMDAVQTKEHASREDPTAGLADVLVVMLSVASLFSVVILLVRTSSTHGGERVVVAVFALASIALSWVLLHTLFMLRYAAKYYAIGGGVDFNQKGDPRYSDFAYLSFVLGMTFQVSDTNITDHGMRVIVLRHSLLSFVFGSIILATTVNFVAGLSGS